MRKILLILILILIVFSNLIFSQEKPFQLKKFDYEINIDARVLPLFVVDKKGNPVFDLKKSDLTLYVNGKKTEIADLIRYKFGYTTKEKKEVSKTVYKKKVKPLDRLVFIVFDTIFNSRYGIKRMKIIAQKIIESGNKGDSFIIMGLNEDDGLFQIYGPSENKNELIKKIKKKIIVIRGKN